MNQEYEEIDLRELFVILFEKKWIIIGVTIFAIIFSFFISYYFLTPQYETFTTLMLGKPQDYSDNSEYSYQEIMVNQKLIGTYAEIAKSKSVLDEVIKNLELNRGYNSLKQSVSVNLLNNTEIIKVTVSGPNRGLIVDVANETAKVFMSEVSKIMKIDNVVVIDEAEVPNNAVSPNIKLNVAIAAVLGLMISIFGIFLREALDNTIKTEDDIRKEFDLPVLGIIPLKEED